MTTVLIRGEGVAASCCAQLLVDQAGLRVVVETAFRPKLPAIMLGEVTQRLLEDVFSCSDLLQGLPQIRKRIVLWGESPEPLTLPHSAVVVNEQELLDRIHRQVPPVKREDRSDAPTLSADWTIHTARRLPSSAVEHHFGSRMAAVAAVKLRPGHDAEVCWVESLEHGWLFLLPSESGHGWLLAAGDAAESLLERSRLVAEQIGECGEVRGQFPAHPRMADPLCEPGWLACGTGAMSFDPLCGDGTGHAAREAILGAAWNHHRPTEYAPYVDGDPRDAFSRGVRADLSTAIHAEASVVAQAARGGRALGGADIYVTTFPCPACARLIAESGFRRCYFTGPYSVLEGDHILRAAGVGLFWVDAPA